MDEQESLRIASEVADAELGVAEELAWPLAAFAAMATHFKWENWLLTVACAGGTYYLAVFRYRRKQAKAEDAYYRSASLGKYAQVHKMSDRADG